MSDPSPRRGVPLTVRVGLLVGGGALVAAFFALRYTTPGTSVSFVPPWDNSAPGELNFWVGALLLLYPGAVLIGLGLEAPLRTIALGFGRRLTESGARKPRDLAILLFLEALFVASLLQHAVLRDRPFTDDEYGAIFGGQVLAHGRLRVAAPAWLDHASNLFLHLQHGQVTSMDFPGALLPWAFGELTSTGPLIFAVFAALCPLGIGLAAWRRHGAAGGWIAAVLALTSPMMVLLSMTSHTHVVSRGLVALAFGVLLWVPRLSLRRGLFGGVMIGGSILTRPVETVALVLPWIVGEALGALRDRERRAGMVGVGLGALIGVLLLVGYDLAAAGTPLFLRMAPNELVHPYAQVFHGPLDLAVWGERFGDNVSYNGLMLALFFAGPAGVALAAWGSGLDPTHRRLGWGVLLALAVAMLHDDRGIHAVGPIHYSEAAVPLSLLAVAGLLRLRHALPAHLVRSLDGGALGYALIGLLVFTYWAAKPLHAQAKVQQALYDLVDRAPAPAVVLAPQYIAAYRATPVGRATGSWIFEWRRNPPSDDAPVVILSDTPEVRGHVKEWFPHRAAFRLSLAQGSEIGLRPLTAAELSGGPSTTPR